MSGILEDPDMETLFSKLSVEITGREQHLVKLQQTLDTFKQKPELFDDKDCGILEGVLQRRTEELKKISQDYTAAKDLYTATVMDLEKRILQKDEILRQADATFGSISAEDELRIHFAQKQVHLQQGLQRAKTKLCATIYERLKPAATPTSPAASSLST